MSKAEHRKGTFARASQFTVGADGHPIVDANGKLIKGPAYTPPDCTPAVVGRDALTDR